MIPLWLTNIWVRRAALALSLVIAYFIWQTHERNIGSKGGVAKEGQLAAEQINGNLQAQREPAVTQITQLTQQINVLQQQVTGQQAILLALVQQQTQVKQQVAGMTPQQVQDAINQVLGKPQGSTDFTLDDKRRALECFDQLPLCQKQSSVQDGVVQDLHQQQDKQDQRYSTLATYTGTVEQAYTSLWNLKAEPKRSPKCLWLWHCTRPQIKAPDPKQLLQRPK